MAQGAYCSGCARRVQLNEAGECPQGHLRSMLRDVREGIEPEARAAAVFVPASASRPAPAAPNELFAVVLGKAIIIVPVALLVAFGLWTGFEQGLGSGMSAGSAVVLSVFSLVATVGGAFVWSAMRRKKR